MEPGGLGALRARARSRWETIPGNARGAILFLVAAAAFSAMGVCIKIAGRTLPVWELIALRTVFALAFMAPAILRAGPRVLHTRRPGAHVLRSLLGLGGMVSYFLAVTHLDLALATTLGFTRILFMILLAVLFLGEHIRWRRTLATVVGFLGVVICVQPGTQAFEIWTLAGLAFAFFGAGVTTLVKRLTATEQPITIVLWSYLVMGGLCVIPCLFVWRTPGVTELTVVGLMGLFSAIGQSCMVNGLKAGEATALMPVDYSRLLFAAAFGFLFFGEVPGASTWLGGTVIVASTLYITLREARLKSAALRRAPPPR